VFCKRYISDDDLSREIETVFKFLIRKIINSGYEYDLQLRDNYFNLYYRGNNLANVSYCQGGNGYEIKIHHKFVDDEMKKMFRHREQRRYLIFMIPQKQLRTFFSNRYLNKMCQKIREIYFQEEVTFEQMIMTDNVNREDFIIIDRQVVKSRMRIDLLALVKKEGADYQFCVIEVKLGKNNEPRKKIIRQLKGYGAFLEEHFDTCKEGYKKNFDQKKYLGLFEKNLYVRNLAINIGSGVLHALVIVGYSGRAEIMIKELKKIDPSIRICQLKNIIDLSKCNNHS
jgi:hypothetical protein